MADKFFGEKVRLDVASKLDKFTSNLDGSTYSEPMLSTSSTTRSEARSE